MILTPYKNLLRIALPMILSNITVPLLALVDTAIVGHLGAAYYLGGVALGAMVTTFLFWLFGFLRMSTTGVTAQSFGAKDEAKQIRQLLQGVFLALCLAIVILLLQSPIFMLALSLTEGSHEVEHYAAIYFHYRIWGIPATLVNFVLLGWMLGRQDGQGPMWYLILTNSVNIFLDFIFVFIFDLSVAGVAMASAIAEYCGLCIGLYWINKHIPWQRLVRQITSEIRKSSYLQIGYLLALNRDIFIRTLLLELCFLFITFQGAKLGDNYIAANAILLNFLLLISYGLDGVAYAVEAAVGKVVGAKEYLKLRQTIRYSMHLGLFFAAIYSLVFLVFGDKIIGLMSDLPDILQVTNEYLLWIVFLPLFSYRCFILDGVFIGLTQSKDMRNMMFWSVSFGFFAVWLLVQPLGLANHALWLALSSLMLSRAITLEIKLKHYLMNHEV